eukprot:TRINITY_DN7493_c0_g1_i1.p1 TRINITY_DN7493_c0_g1~~TRINITY_DN7493_c0_g1_i1.p1  ORF type:complete len:511 (-),score=101.51 TRINITY_DN7493_c0_g1_i1:298-1830(-)
MSASDLYTENPFLAEIGITPENAGCYNGRWEAHGEVMHTLSPHDNRAIAGIRQATAEDYESCLAAMETARPVWQLMPAPQRGELVRRIGEELRKYKHALGRLISLEMGKILAEGEGEVQEFIDMCDFATGLSRMITGSVIPSERPGHVILERWNPLGHVGVISAFNFPMAVYGWNVTLALICGNTVIWKGASSTSLCTIAIMKIIARVLETANVPGAVCTMVAGPGRSVGDRLINDKRLSLISFTGSTEIGRRVSTAVASRFGRTILELGGNNGIIVMPDADLKLLVPAVVFGAVGTCGQRCTTTRRLFLHESVYDQVVASLLNAYKQVKIGNPLSQGTLCGPLHTPAAVTEYLEGLEAIKAQGGKIIYGGSKIEGPGNYVHPTLVEINPEAEIIKTELFVPITYIMKFSTFEEAVKHHNSVPQGLSSAIFTRDHLRVWEWLGPLGSDCGLVNVNIGTSGAEIGGAFGGEKETGCGREAGSDSWKQYMRRSTCTINYTSQLVLAQGIKFE